MQSFSTIIKDETSTHFEAFFNHATIGILLTDTAGNISAINPFALKEFGFKKQELINKNIKLLIPIRMRKPYLSNFENYTSEKHLSKSIKTKDLIAIKKNGLEFPIEICLGKYYKNGAKYIIAFINDITVRINASSKIEKLNVVLENKVTDRTIELGNTILQLEKQIAETNLIEGELKKFQKLFLQMLSNYPDGAISIIDKDNNFIYTGGMLHTQSGLNPTELIGKRIYPEFEETLRASIEACLKKVLSEKIIVSNFELPQKHNGYTYVMDAFPLIDEDETKNKVGVIIRNISILKKIEEDLREGLEKEKELSELKSRFVSMASHEFRSPLSTILSSSYLLEKYTLTHDQKKREKHVQRIVSSVNMLTDILNDFLSEGKIEEGKIQVRVLEVNIVHLLKSIISEIKSLLKKGQKLKYEHTGVEIIEIDPSLLKHIVINLVSNASKFSNEGTAINLKTNVENNQLLFSVKDRGIGISNEDQKHLTERFFRGANASNIQGTGLGLHIVSKYADLMNGELICNSELNIGTEFTVTLNL